MLLTNVVTHTTSGSVCGHNINNHATYVVTTSGLSPITRWLCGHIVVHCGHNLRSPERLHYAPGAYDAGTMASSLQNLPTYDDVLAAAQRIEGVAHHTPVLTSRALNERFGMELYFKAENLQRAGAFKFRGAYNSIYQLTPEERARGVVAFSSGNHAQAVSLAGSLLGAPVTIVMPEDAPVAKIEATRGYGAEVVLFDRFTQDREEITQEIVNRTNGTLLPPFNQAGVIAGQGTATLELLREVPGIQALFVPLGGGGLLAGASLVAEAIAPNVQVYGGEPKAADDGQQSFRTGSIVTIPSPHTVADGAQALAVGEIPFEVFKRHITDIVTVGEQELINMVLLLLQRMKILVEPTGVLGVAAAVEMKEQLAGKKVGVILSGGNVDLTRIGEWAHAR